MKIYVDIINKKTSVEIMEKLNAIGCFILDDGKITEKLNKILADNPTMVYIIDTEDVDLQIKTSNDCKNTLINPNKTKTNGLMLIGRTNDVYDYIIKNNNFVIDDLNESNDNETNINDDCDIIDFGTVEIIIGSYVNEYEAELDRIKMEQCGISCKIKKNNKKYLIILTCDVSNKKNIEKRLTQLGLNDITENDTINHFKIGNRVRVKKNSFNVNGTKLNNACDVYVIRKIDAFTAHIYRINSNVLYDKIHLKYLYKI